MFMDRLANNNDHARVKKEEEAFIQLKTNMISI
jgi:hypothetical protein